MRGGTGGLAAHRAGRRTAHRPGPVAPADRARPGPWYLPDRGAPGPGAAAPAASHEAGDPPLVPGVVTDRPRAHPLPARPAHRCLLPVGPPPAGLADPLAASRPPPRPAPDQVKADAPSGPSGRPPNQWLSVRPACSGPSRLSRDGDQELPVVDHGAVRRVVRNGGEGDEVVAERALSFLGERL